MQISENVKEAAFAAGCFWGVEARFLEVEGVVNTEVGYMGGIKEEPTYKEVCSGKTGHAETVHLFYDPNKVSYHELLETFWSMHNPTTPNRQGVDVGTQYRSVIFYYDQEQRELAERSKEALDASGRYRKKIVTEIVPAPNFWRAEEYHQRYFEKKGGGTCHV
ncbi:MAG: peptide-methionine (S)-S-oxide reductase MsrA [Methanomassiliicoccales archaeon]|nr:peptide-methionine (S)-S-oxide reductase MsrA [Methanomassiliicoccales archaeon]NYT15282.1 peptide-methionine (S)-S-oxide reductase MsrA [Methanomassiliicoccales archaeon]